MLSKRRELAALLLSACVLIGSAAANEPGSATIEETCALLKRTQLTRAEATLADAPDGAADSVRYLYNFSAATVDCPDQSFPTSYGAVRPAFMAIGVSTDRQIGVVHVETIESTPLGVGFACAFGQNNNSWHEIGCWSTTTWTHTPPPNPLPIQ